MSVAGDNEFWISSWGWERRVAPDRWHRVWRVYWTAKPGQRATVTGPRDVEKALAKAWAVRDRLDFRPIEELRVITEVDVYEVSLVTDPVDPNCTIEVIGGRTGYKED